ncbi:MAG: ketopantoate reductase family protein [Saccharofermentanales bacterium]|jgi:2-dehydropantoate 2-reductase|nr:2-dehydropantoate 2-reductase [Bacillota bacterium]
MKQIKTVSLIGLGALGLLFAEPFASAASPGGFRVIADASRQEKYRKEGLYNNDKELSFNMFRPDETCEPADLLIFAVKYGQLPRAIADVARHVGDQTIILSLLNGISSEEDIRAVYGDKVIGCTVQGMDATKEGNRLYWKNMGGFTLGELYSDQITPRLLLVADYLTRAKIPYTLVTDMRDRMWGKFMLNVGINQVVSVCEGNYGLVQREGPERERMIAAMREVIPLAEAEGIRLGEKDILYWLDVIKPLAAEGMPSMRQDLLQGRKTEVDLFAGTVVKLGHKYGIATPINQALLEEILTLEKDF